jgi:nucleotide-binding universal stress UspA family protein
MDSLRPALERIVVGMDFGMPSIEAARWVATTFAPGVELIMTYALDLHATDLTGVPRPSALAGPEDEDAARRQLHEVAREVAPHGAYRVEVREDGAARAILAVATECGADLVVVGPHGGRETPRGIGTTAERLIRTSPVPLLLVSQPRPRRLQRLLVPVDGGDLTRMVLEWADFVAKRDGAQTTLLHVVDPSTHASESSASTSDDRWLSSLAAEGPEPERTTALTVSGKPADEILAAVERLDADLVVMGRRSRRRVLSGVVGSTASDTLRNAPCPVLIVVDPPNAMLDEWMTTESQSSS